MKGMIFAAGKGERLLPITNAVPKPLCTVLNKPIIEYNVEMLARAGASEIMINLFHLGSQIEAYLGNGERFGVKLSYSHEESLWGTGGGLKQVEDFFLGEEFFIVANGDTLFDVDLREVIEFHAQHKAVATMALTAKADLSHYGAVETAADHTVVNIAGRIEKPSKPAAAKAVFAGVHVLSPKIFEYIPPAIPTCINAYAYPKLLANGEKVVGYLYREGYWSDLGTPERLFAANMAVLDKSMTFTHLNPYSRYTSTPRKEQTGFVGMGKNVEFAGTAQFLPPIAFGNMITVGEESVIGPFCCIGDNCVIGRRASLVSTLVMPGTTVPDKAKLEDVIIAGKFKHHVEIP